MLPIPGETYQEYLNRVSATDEIAYTIQELRDMGWEEMAGGQLWIAEIQGETPPGGGYDETPPTPEPGSGGEDIITLVTIYFLVWCIDPDTGETVGPYTQMIDVDWYNTSVYAVYNMVDQAAQQFCALAMWRQSPRNVSKVKITDQYSWEIVAPFGLRYSHGI